MPESFESHSTTRTSIGGPGQLRLTCSNLGASIMSLQVPYKKGYLDIVTGYPEAVDYLGDPYYMGALCGRFAGRIANAEFWLNGARHSITTDSPGEHALHGGVSGFNTRHWRQLPAKRENAITYTLESPHGDQGFPANLSVAVTYSIERNMRLVVDVVASSDGDTLLNLVSHAYFNLNADDKPINNHRVRLFANDYTPLDSTGIPTGEIRSVTESPFDFRTGNGRALEDAKYDQNFVLDKTQGKLALAAVVSVDEHPVSLAVHTDLPGLQLYTGDQLAGVFKPRDGLCLEAQQFPDAPNQPHFPTTVLRKGSEFRSKTVYVFGLKADICKL